jgi:hypothetical protein
MIVSLSIKNILLAYILIFTSSCACSIKSLLRRSHTNKKFLYILSWYISCSLIYEACKKQIENENHESVQIFHAHSVTFCLLSSLIHLDIHMWGWEHISANLFLLQGISIFSAKHSPDDIKHYPVQISHWFFTILPNWHYMSLVSCLLQAMNLKLCWVKGNTTFHMACISYWPNRNSFSWYGMMWLIGFYIFKNRSVVHYVCL